MYYTYTYEIQGIDRCSHYLKFRLDRSVSSKTSYAGSRILPPTGPAAKLAKRLQDMTEVVKVGNGECGPGHINLSGDLVVVKVCALQPIQIVPLAQRIIKKIQRVFAKGEGRKRIKFDALKAYAKNLNERTAGAQTI